MLAHIFPPDFERRTFEAKSFLTVVPEVWYAGVLRFVQSYKILFNLTMRWLPTT
jgi:hypothetical protein